MIVNMSEKATEQEINHIIERIREAGYNPHVTRGTERTIVAAVGQRTPPRNRGPPGRSWSRQRRGHRAALQAGQPPGQARTHRREDQRRRHRRSRRRGHRRPLLGRIAQQLLDTAHAVKRAGAAMLRGGAYKPRTSPV
jgi:3-deoxy-7-phosphoheptulonate synthase